MRNLRCSSASWPSMSVGACRARGGVRSAGVTPSRRCSGVRACPHVPPARPRAAPGARAHAATRTAATGVPAPPARGRRTRRQNRQWRTLTRASVSRAAMVGCARRAQWAVDLRATLRGAARADRRGRGGRAAEGLALKPLRQRCHAGRGPLRRCAHPCISRAGLPISKVTRTARLLLASAGRPRAAARAGPAA